MKFFTKLFCCLVLLQSFILSGQIPRDTAEAEILRQKIAQTPRDEVEKINMLYDLGFYVLNIDLDSALTIFTQIKEMSEHLGYKEGVIHYYVGASNVYNYKGQVKESLQLNLESLDVANEIEDRSYLAKQLANVGISYNYLGDYEQAIQYIRKALNIYIELDDQEKIGRLYFTIGMLYNNLSKDIHLDSTTLSQALAYFDQALPIARALKDTLLEIEILTNQGISFNNAFHFESANLTLSQAEVIAQDFGMVALLEQVYRAISVTKRELKDYISAEEYAFKALEISKNWGANLYEVLTKKELALVYSKNAQYAKAIEVLETIIPMAEAGNMTYVLDGLYINYGENLAEVHKYDLAYWYFKKGSALSDSLRGTEIKSRLLSLEKKFDSAKKDAQILELNLEKQRQLGWIIALIVVLLLSGLVGFFLVNQWRYKAKITEQEKIQIQKEQQLRYSESIIRGQEEERQRIARDLHDGLGGLLSGLKFTLHNMEGNNIISGQSANIFHKALDQLDQAISEMRKVARNMMPETLVNFGLDITLQDYAVDLSESFAPLKVHYQSYGYKRMEQQVEITLYRIIQEAINNVIKHAQAQDIFIQLNQDSEQVIMSIEDNGKGFNMNQQTTGLGLKNIYNRVHYLNGELEINSRIGTGTTIVLAIKLNSNGQ